MYLSILRDSCDFYHTYVQYWASLIALFWAIANCVTLTIKYNTIQ